jgi:hypothetical protein
MARGFSNEEGIGAPLIGSLVSCVLFGLSSAATIVYYDRFPEDRLARRLLVGVLLFVNFLDTTFTAMSVYWRLVNNFGNFIGILQLDWRSQSHLPLLAIISFGTQMWFVVKIYHLFNRQLWLPVPIFLCSA